MTTAVLSPAALPRLPSLYFHAGSALLALYALFAAAMYWLVERGALQPGRAAIIFALLGIGQFIVGPFLMDWGLRRFHKMRWVTTDELPPHLVEFVAKVCGARGMRTPRFGLIDDHAPQAFTYGHHPNNARLVLSKGTIEMLAADELEAVVAHEIGHSVHWDMVVMTVALFVPMVFYEIYKNADESARKSKNKKERDGSAQLAFFAMVLYEVTLRVALWLSRQREYHADRFAATITGNPNALARALVKIAYGMATQSPSGESGSNGESEGGRRVDPLAALNIFDRRAALNLVVSTSGLSSQGPGGFDPNRLQDAMQWDLWNPWASFHELSSTHPLVAKRLIVLAEHARALGQEPFAVFDRTRPESYWDEFLVDVLIFALPITSAVAVLLSGGIFRIDLADIGPAELPWVGAALLPLGVFGLIKTLRSYWARSFPGQTVAQLIAHVKVSPVRPVPATVEGTIIGRGVPGLIFCEDFVLRDSTGIILLDYRQPFQLWSFIFGLLRAQSYEAKCVRVAGWFRREPVPYLEIGRLELLDEEGNPHYARRCYTFHARVIWDTLLAIAGIVLLLYGFGYFDSSIPAAREGFLQMEDDADAFWVAAEAVLAPVGVALSQTAAAVGVPLVVILMLVSLPIAALLFGSGMALMALWDLRLDMRKRLWG